MRKTFTKAAAGIALVVAITAGYASVTTSHAEAGGRLGTPTHHGRI